MVSTGITWVVIKNLVTEGAEGITLERFTFDLGIKSAYVDGTDIKVGVRRSPGGGDMTGIKFIFFNGTDSISIEKVITSSPADRPIVSLSLLFTNS